MRVTLPVYATFEVPDDKRITEILEAITNGAYTYYDPADPKAMRVFQLSARLPVPVEPEAPRGSSHYWDSFFDFAKEFFKG